MNDRSVRDSRAHQRGLAPRGATVLSGDDSRAEYLVRNLSAGGALLLHGPAIRVGTQIRVLLHGVQRESIEATVVRCGAILNGVIATAVKFDALSADAEDRIQRLVLQELERPRQPSVLVALQRPRLFPWLSAELHDLGRHLTLAVTALDAIEQLRSRDCTIEAVLIEHFGSLGFDRELLALLSDEFPDVRRVLVCERLDPDVTTVPHSRAHAVLVQPWTQSEFARALDAATRDRSESSWSDYPA